MVEPFIHLLLSHGANPNVRRPGKDNTSGLWMALNQLKSGKISRAADCFLRECNVEGAEKISPEIYNERDPNPKSNLTPFFLCCLYRQDNALLNLMKLKADGMEESCDIPKLKMCPKLPPKCNAFEAAAYSGCATTIKLFLENDADGARQKALLSPPVGWVETWVGVENVPLIVIGVSRATPAESEVFADLILKYEVDVNTPHIEGMNILLIMTAVGHTNAATKLLNSDKLKCDLTVADVHGRNIVWYASYACVADRSKILAAVLERGADATVSDKAGVTPLLAACRNGDEKSAMILLNKPFTPQNRRVDNPDYVNPIKKKKEKEKKEKPKRRSFEALKERAKAKIAEKKASMASKGEDDGGDEHEKHKSAQSTSEMIPRIPRNVILGATQSDEIGWAKIPLPPYSPGPWKGIPADEVNKKDALGYTPLWYAVLWCNTDMVRMLISCPECDVNAQNKGGLGGNGMTPLMLSACVKARGKLDIFFMLLKHPKIALDAKSDSGHTVYDIAYLEELEFVLKPMTRALEKRDCVLSKDLEDAKEFKETHSVTWKDPNKKMKAGNAATSLGMGMTKSAVPEVASMGLLLGKEANPIWRKLLTAEPFYANTLWLRKLVAYDLVASQELRKEWVRQKKDIAKYASLKATIHTASVLHMLKIGGSMVTAMKYAARLALSTWLVYKACGVREYDLEYYLARKEAPDEGLHDVTDASEYIKRVHIPEDFGENRVHVGRYMKHSSSKEDKAVLQSLEEKGVVHPERWVRKKRPKELASWA